MNEELKVIITAETEKLNKEIDKSKDKVEEFGKDSEKSFGDFEDSLGKAKNFCKSAMKVMATAITGAVTAMGVLSESTKDLRTNQAKLKTTFESAGASADVAAKVYDDLFRVLGDDDQTTEAAAHLAKLTTNQEELSEWTSICKGVYAEFGNSLPIEGLTEAANETAKVGTVTGALADALNWAGINEDKFNEQLAACNDEAKRERLIRETLNKIYKTSATNYEKNNASVLKNNEAQNKLNKTMAKTGEHIEPVMTELKEMGATILKDLEAPIKSVSKWLTNTFFPALKSVYSWIKNNLPEITALVIGLTTAYVSYKAVTLATTAAEEGLTAAIVLKTAAQKAWNKVMALNPYGLLAAGIGLVTTGLIAYASQSSRTVKIVENLTEEEKELIKQVQESNTAFRDKIASYEESAAAIMGQSEHTKKLAEELLKLADASGKVAKEDQTRAQFILNELNEAYGTEYTIVDGVIQKYGELQNSIYDVIDAKTASALLEAKNDAYITAIQEEDEALQAVVLAQKDYEAQHKAAIEANTDAAQAYDKYIEILNEYGVSAAASYGLQWKLLEHDAAKQEEAAENKKATYKDLAKAYAEHHTTIEEYEEAAMLIQEGNSKEAINLLKNKSEAYFEYADDVSKATQEAIDNLYKEAVDAGLAAEDIKENFRNGVEGYTEEMVLEAEEAYNAALDKWANAYQDANKVGKDLGDGLSGGMESKKSDLVKKAKTLVGQIIGAMKVAADSHSPSKKTMAFGKDLGKGTEIGIDDSAKDVAKASKNMVAQSLKAISGFTATNFKGRVTGSIMSARGYTSTNKTIATPEMTSLLGAIGERLSGSNTPIVLQVDGKTFAQTAINTINQQTKQSGKLGLSII